MTEKMLERIIVHLPETLYLDVVRTAERRDLAASAYIRKLLEKDMYGAVGMRDAKRIEEDRRS
ncbi:MAG: hypothetical protein IPL99_12465 [Candidatus Competibacteraceae bacterium]|nr:hypothetical protein [Candidatus Competibacteraceae bacterium]